MDTAADFAFRRIARAGNQRAIDRPIAAEAPVAIEVNGLGYAVLMATPSDLADLAVGFALSERLIEQPAEMMDLDCHRAEQGWIVRLTLASDGARGFQTRVRNRASDSACGLCGVENLEQALRPLPRVPAWTGGREAVFTAADALAACQPLNRRTRAVHAAAWCSRDGAIRLVREDVGRHNAFDKLIGAMAQAGANWDGGFALLSSRCSYELVEKAALAGCPMLATISAPTDLALRRAAEAGLRLHCLVRPDAMLATT